MPNFGVNPFGFAFVTVWMFVAYIYAREFGRSGDPVAIVSGGAFAGLFIGGFWAYLFSGWGGLLVPALFGIAGAAAGSERDEMEREIRALGRELQERRWELEREHDYSRKQVWNWTFDVVEGFHSKYGHFPTSLRLSNAAHNDLFAHLHLKYGCYVTDFPFVVLPEELPYFQAEDDEGNILRLTDYPTQRITTHMVESPLFPWERCELEE